MMKVMGSVLAMVVMCGRMSWAQVIGLIFILSLVSLGLFPMWGSYSPTPFLSLTSLSVLLISLSLWLMALGFIASYGILQSRKEPKMFCLVALILLFCLVVTFSVNSFLKFYIAFECTLIPTMFLIVRWGNQPERILASMYMLMYTLAASLPLLTSLLVVFFFSGSLSMVLLTVTPSLGVKLSVCLFFAFLVKLPMYLFHQWLPKAHVEAPVAGSMILAGVLLKLGAYGLFVVFYMNLSLGPMKYLLSSVALLGACVTALVCVRQGDMKALIAYASVSHMSLMLVAILSQSTYGWQGAGIMLIAHGLTSSGLFACVGGMYDNYKTRSLMLVKALLSHSPVMGLWWFLLLMSNMAAPPFINLPAEMVIIGVISSVWVFPYIIMVMGLIFVTASYSLLLFTVSSHGVPQTIMNITMINSSRVHLLMVLHLLPLGLIMLVLPLVVV